MGSVALLTYNGLGGAFTLFKNSRSESSICNKVSSAMKVNPEHYSAAKTINICGERKLSHIVSERRIREECSICLLARVLLSLGPESAA